MKSKLGLIVLALAVIAIVVVSVVWRKEPGEPVGTKGESIRLRLKWIVTAGFAGDYHAKHAGLFEKEGLKVEIRTGGPQANPLLLVPAGEDDLGVAGADALIMARANGVPVVAIGAVFQRNGSGYFTKKDSGILTPEDWKGHRVGILAGNDTETIFRALLKHNNIDPSSVTEVPIGFDLTPFLTGQIDVQPGYIPNQPNLLKAKGVEVNIIDPRNHGVSILGNVYFTTEKMLRENPDVVRRFLRAVFEGWKQAIDKPDAAVAALIKEEPKLNAKAQLAVLKDTIPFVRREDGNLGRMDKKAWVRTVDVLRKVGILKKPVDVDHLFTNEYLPY